MAFISSYVIYFVVFSISVFFSYLYVKNTEMYAEKKLVKTKFSYAALQMFALLGVLLPLVILFTFRYGVGEDYFSYLDDYNWYGPREFNVLPYGYTEMGYGAINIIEYRLFNSYTGLLFLNSLLILLPAIWALILFDTKQFPIGLSIYLLTLFPSSFNGMRQHIAVSFTMLAIVLIYKGKMFKYIFCVLVAILFHKTSIIDFLFLFLCKNRRKNEYLKFIGMIILIVIGIILIEPMMRVISKLPVISFYFNKYNDTYNAYSLTHYVVHSVFRLPLAFILLIYNKKIIEKNNKNLVIIICPFIDFIFIFMSKVIRWTIRMTYFTMAAMPLSIMLIGSNDEIKDRDKKLVIFLLIITLILRFIALFGYADYDGIIPYQFSF